MTNESLHRRLNDESSAIPHETQYTIAAWSKKTFGPKSALVIARRALVEFGEMITELEKFDALVNGRAGAYQSGEEFRQEREAARAAAVEAADVLIMLYSVVNGLKHDMMALVDEKMVINRKREWHTDPTTGRTQHVPGTGELDFSISGPGTVKGAFLSDERPGEGEGRLVSVTLFDSFKEPGSGLTMQRDRWYILSDSGSSYSPYGFRTADEAREWFASPAARDLYGGELKLSQPSYLPPTDDDMPHGGWDDEWEAANVLLGLDLMNFWLSNDRELFMGLNPGFEK